jgi:phage/plasmid-like protein (TIGR03299 family)
MPHEVETMMYAGAAPWHRLGRRMERPVAAPEALVAAELDWRVKTAPVFALDDGDETPVESHRAVVRARDGRALGVVGARYRPIQNEEAFAFLDSVCSEGAAQIHTAGSLEGGRRIWALAKLPGEIRVHQDDVTEKYLLLVNSHDGSMALRLFFTPVRVVCANTLNLALRSGASDGISIRHTASATRRIEEARRALGIAGSFYSEFDAVAQRLVRSPFTDAQMRELARRVLPAANDGEASARLEKTRDKVVELYSEGRGHGPIRGTAWAAWNAVAEFADHHRVNRGRDERARMESRLSSAWFGTGALMKRRAYQAITSQLAA